MKRTMMIFIAIVFILVIAVVIVLQQKTFGKNPDGARLARILRSPNYSNGSFQNLAHTEVTRKDVSYIQMLKDYFNKPKTTSPDRIIPTVKTRLSDISANTPSVIWFGHSSYLIKSGNLNILVDPVLCGYASPFSFLGKSYKGTDVYTPQDMPAIDILILTHDHYDHLDYETIMKIMPKVKHIYTSLGVGSHLEYWGVPPTSITELDWWEGVSVADSISLTAVPARHFSGRLFTRGKSLWSAFVLQVHGYSVFVGGDSGYGSHFKAIGEKFGPFDLALLECGQYGTDWPFIHMFPEETILAAKDLHAKVLMPVHWAKFSLSIHDWNEPIKRLLASAKGADGIKITTPMIGEEVQMGTLYPSAAWWE